MLTQNYTVDAMHDLPEGVIGRTTYALSGFP